MKYDGHIPDLLVRRCSPLLTGPPQLSEEHQRQFRPFSSSVYHGKMMISKV
jgi:hypothetical protein